MSRLPKNHKGPQSGAHHVSHSASYGHTFQPRLRDIMRLLWIWLTFRGPTLLVAVRVRMEATLSRGGRAGEKLGVAAVPSAWVLQVRSRKALAKALAEEGGHVEVEKVQDEAAE